MLSPKIFIACCAKAGLESCPAACLHLEIDLFHFSIKNGACSEVPGPGTSILCHYLMAVTSGRVIFDFKYTGACNPRLYILRFLSVLGSGVKPSPRQAVPLTLKVRTSEEARFGILPCLTLWPSSGGGNSWLFEETGFALMTILPARGVPTGFVGYAGLPLGLPDVGFLPPLMPIRLLPEHET